MNSGSITYSPDYKSEKRPRGKIEHAADPKIKTLYGHVTAFDDAALIATNREAERSRLESEVIEAAKKYRLAVREHLEYANECMARDPSHDEDEDPKWDAQLGAQCSAEQALSNTVDALLAFEESQIKK